eukprot:gnl/TRDRNA2_/TRDRNA2_183084_c0_seq1.p1 gnl/TRDRNA2_/TRDRNA2_183084_c0~~gnl/TRDRNA2_/TRDRNA2_183084_c0_seq1.p1  ORF type:complete len:590 (-),score=74.45 gnl/TRDRNA2_/TRDRNA2_183084_c0_seq1:25-1794(-)
MRILQACLLFDIIARSFGLQSLPTAESCSDSELQKPSLFIGIFSGTTNYRRRDAQRKQCIPEYRKHGVAYKFFIGRPSHIADTSRATAGFWAAQQAALQKVPVSKGMLATDFERNTSLVLLQENEEYGDIQLIPVRDHYRDKTDKQFHIFRHGLRREESLLAKVDDDACLNVTLLRSIYAQHGFTEGAEIYGGSTYFRGDEYTRMIGTDGSKAPFFSGHIEILSRKLARAIYEDNSNYVMAYQVWGSSSEDSNLGKLVHHVQKSGHVGNVVLVNDPGLEVPLLPPSNFFNKKVSPHQRMRQLDTVKSPSDLGLATRSRSMLTCDNSTAGSDSLFVGIFSAPENFEQRTRQRERCIPRYREAGIRYRFFVGHPSHANVTWNTTLSRKLADKLGDEADTIVGIQTVPTGQGLKSTPWEFTTAGSLLEESNKHGDMALVPMRDLDWDKTDKLINVFQEGLRSTESLLAKVDDDWCINLETLKKMESRRKCSDTGLLELYGGSRSFKGTEESYMRGVDGNTAPFIAGEVEILSRNLAHAIFENSALRVMTWHVYGSAHEDANLGRFVDHVVKTGEVGHVEVLSDPDIITQAVL